MTIPCLSQDEFLDILKSNGCEILSDEYWQDHDTLVLQKGDNIFTLKLEKKYFYPAAVTKLRDLGITPPEDHLRSFYQHFSPEEPCFCNGLKKFSECHGKQ